MPVNNFRDKRVLVTGAAGTVGKALVKKLLEDNLVGELIALDNNESEVFFLNEMYRGKYNFVGHVADVRDKEKMKRLTRGVDVIFHAAAYKHVILSEMDPFDYVQVNAIGTQNLLEAALENNVELLINTSTDKAVNPTNVMGATKLLGERLVSAANVYAGTPKVKFSSVRFGNVLGSRGSLLPLLIKQIKQGGPVTLTDERMTRFVMSIQDAVYLVLKSANLAKGGEVFVLKMKAVRILDLIKAVIELVAPRFGYRPEDIEIKKIGAKPGEKLYEELMNSEEITHAWELKDMFVILPRFKDFYKGRSYEYPDLVSKKVDKPYISAEEEFLSIDEIKRYLTEHKIIEYAMEGEL